MATNENEPRSAKENCILKKWIDDLAVLEQYECLKNVQEFKKILSELKNHSCSFSSFSKHVDALAKNGGDGVREAANKLLSEWYDELKEIRKCIDCYLCYSAGGNNPDHFTLFCTKPHLLVYLQESKENGSRWWPAKVLSENDDGTVNTACFGDYKRAVNYKFAQCIIFADTDEELSKKIKEAEEAVEQAKLAISKKSKKSKQIIEGKEAFVRAFEEVKKYIENVEKRYGNSTKQAFVRASDKEIVVDVNQHLKVMFPAAFEQDDDTALQAAMSYDPIETDDNDGSNETDDNLADLSNQKPSTYVVTMVDTIKKHMEYFEMIEKAIGADETVNCAPSLMDCFNKCKSRDHIYLPIGRHSIKLLEPLNSGGLLKAITCMDANKALEFNIETSKPTDYTVLTFEETENVFINFNGDYTIENVILDCRQAGILIEDGTVTFKNCHLIGDRSSSTEIGICIMGNAKCVLEKSYMQNFATGITCAANGSLSLNQTSIFNCGMAVETEDTATIEIASSKLFNNSKYGIYLKTKVENIFAAEEKRKIVSDLVELRKLLPSFALNGDCSFEDNKKGNINIVDQKNHI